MAVINQLPHAGGGSAPVLLWTNPSPNANFAAQTVTLDLSNYTGIIIYGWVSISDTVKGWTYIPKDNSGNTGIKDTISGGSGLIGTYNGNRMAGRPIRCNDSGVVFSNGYNGSGQTLQNCGVPIKIWGVTLEGMDV